MDKLYKSLFLKSVKNLMLLEFGDFVAYKLEKGQPNRELFTGAILYKKNLHLKYDIWIIWVPGEGSTRRFDVRLGWSIGDNILPAPESFSHELFTSRAPFPGVCGGSFELDRFEGKNAIGGIDIPSPLDQLSKFNLSTPKDVYHEAQIAAFNEDNALSTPERQLAVNRALHPLIARIKTQLPIFIDAVENLP